MSLPVILILCFLTLIVIICILLAFKDDKFIDHENRIKFLEEQINRRLISRKNFVELKSINSVLDTINHCFYLIDDKGDYIVDSEYRLENVTDDWWSSLSIGDLEMVNKIKKE
jgi:hypothetical protein